MPPFVQASQVPPSAVPTSADVRAAVLDPLRMTPEQTRRLSGLSCARCGGREELRPGGMAYTLSGPDGSGRLAWPVQVCRHHSNTGGTW